MESEKNHIIATFAWVAVCILALIVLAPSKPAAEAVTAPEALAHEVAVQCANEVNGTLDALAEGESTDVPSPVWEETVALCDAEFDSGANYAEAPVAVLASLGAA